MSISKTDLITQIANSSGLSGKALADLKANLNSKSLDELSAIISNEKIQVASFKAPWEEGFKPSAIDDMFDFKSSIQPKKAPKPQTKQEAIATREFAKVLVDYTLKQAQSSLEQYYDNNGWASMAFYFEKASEGISAGLKKVGVDGYATTKDMINGLAGTRLITSGASTQSEVNFKNRLAECAIQYNQAGARELQEYIAKTPEFSPENKEYKALMNKAFGAEFAKLQEDVIKKIGYKQFTSGVADIALMLGSLGAAAEIKVVATATQTVIKTGAKLAQFGTTMGKVGTTAGAMVVGGTNLAAWTASTGTINNLTKAAETTSDDWKYMGIATAESFGFGAFGGLLHATVVAPIVNAVSKPAQKAANVVANTLTSESSLSAKDVMRTFLVNQVPTKVGNAIGFGTEIVGFTTYETALDVVKDICSPDGRLPENMTAENLAQYLGEKFVGQAKMLGEIKGISSLLMMHKGGKLGQKAVIDNMLNQTKVLDQIKIKKMNLEGKDLYEVTMPDGKKTSARSIEQVLGYCENIMSTSIKNIKNAKTVLDIKDNTPLTEETIKNAYKKAAVKNHPDKGGSAAKMSEINAAVNTLKTDLGITKPKSQTQGKVAPFAQRLLNTPKIEDGPIIPNKVTFIEDGIVYKKSSNPLVKDKILFGDKPLAENKNALKEQIRLIPEYNQHEGTIESFLKNSMSKDQIQNASLFLHMTKGSSLKHVYDLGKIFEHCKTIDDTILVAKMSNININVSLFEKYKPQFEANPAKMELLNQLSNNIDAIQANLKENKSLDSFQEYDLSNIIKGVETPLQARAAAELLMNPNVVKNNYYLGQKIESCLPFITRAEQMDLFKSIVGKGGEHHPSIELVKEVMNLTNPNQMETASHLANVGSYCLNTSTLLELAKQADTPQKAEIIKKYTKEEPYERIYQDLNDIMKTFDNPELADGMYKFLNRDVAPELLEKPFNHYNKPSLINDMRYLLMEKESATRVLELFEIDPNLHTSDYQDLASYTIHSGWQTESRNLSFRISDADFQNLISLKKDKTFENELGRSLTQKELEFFASNTQNPKQIEYLSQKITPNTNVDQLAQQTLFASSIKEDVHLELADFLNTKYNEDPNHYKRKDNYRDVFGVVNTQEQFEMFKSYDKKGFTLETIIQVMKNDNTKTTFEAFKALENSKYALNKDNSQLVRLLAYTDTESKSTIVKQTIELSEKFDLNPQNPHSFKPMKFNMEELSDVLSKIDEAQSQNMLQKIELLQNVDGEACKAIEEHCTGYLDSKSVIKEILQDHSFSSETLSKNIDIINQKPEVLTLGLTDKVLKSEALLENFAWINNAKNFIENDNHLKRFFHELNSDAKISKIQLEMADFANKNFGNNPMLFNNIIRLIEQVSPNETLALKQKALLENIFANHPDLKHDSASILHSVAKTPELVNFISKYLGDKTLSDKNLPKILNAIWYKEPAIRDFVTEKLCFNTDFNQKDLIASIGATTTEKNMSLVKKLCLDNRFAQKELIADIGGATQKNSIHLVEKLCFDSEFTQKELIASIGKSINQDNVDLATKLCFDPKFTQKDLIAGIAKNAKENNMELAQKLCAEKGFPKDKIANILENTTEINLELAKTLCAKQDLDKTVIHNLLSEANTKDLVQKYEKIFDEPKLNKFVTQQLNNSRTFAETVFLAQTQSRISADNQKNQKQEAQQTRQNSTINQNQSSPDLASFNNRLADKGVEAKPAEFILKACVQDGKINPQMRDVTFELLDIGVSSKDIGEILSASKIDGEFRLQIVEDYLSLRNLGLNSMMQKNLAAINNMSASEVTSNFAPAIKKQMKTMLDKMPPKQVTKLQEKGIDTNEISGKLENKITNATPNGTKTLKGTKLRSRAKIVGAEKIILDKYIKEVPENIWRDSDKFKTWAQEKVAQVANYDANPQYHLGLNIGFANPQYIIENRKTLITQWHKHLSTESTLKDDPFAQLMVMNEITKEMKPDNASVPPQVDPSRVETVFNQLLEANDGVSFSSLYDAATKDAAMRLARPTQTVDGHTGQWVTIPRTSMENPKYKDHVAYIQALSQGTNWCLRFSQADSYIQQGDINFFVDTQGRAQVCVREDSPDGHIYEIQKRQQNATVPIAYANVVQDFVKSKNLHGCEDEIQKAVNQKPAYDELRAEMTALNEKQNFQAIFEKMGIKTEVAADDTYILSSYNGKIGAYTLSELNVNEAALLANVSQIKGDADFSNSSITKFEQIKTIGRLKNVTEFSKIDVRTLQTLNSTPMVWDNPNPAPEPPKKTIAQIAQERYDAIKDKNMDIKFDEKFEDDGVYGFTSPEESAIRDYLRTRQLMPLGLVDESLQLKNIINLSKEATSQTNAPFEALSKPIVNQKGENLVLFEKTAPVAGNNVRGKTPLSGNSKNLPFRMKKLKQAGIERVIDLRAPKEASEKSLEACKSNNIEYVNFSVEDMNWTPENIANIPKFIKTMNKGNCYVGCANGEARTDLAMAIYYTLNPEKNALPSFYFGSKSTSRVGLLDNLARITRNMPESIIKELGWKDVAEFKKFTKKRMMDINNSLEK